MNHPETPPERLGLLSLFLIFVRIGCLSWGGGGATLAMLHSEFCGRRSLVSDEEFQVLFGISRITPGINLVSLTVLLGYRLHRWMGALCALVGLTIPSFLFIVLGCYLFRGKHPHPLILAAVHGLKPAIVALLAHTLWQLNEKSLRSQGWLSRVLWMTVFLTVALLALRGAIHPAWLMLGGGLIGVALARWTVSGQGTRA